MLIVTRLNDILIESSAECQPVPAKRRKPSNFKWTPELKPYVQRSKKMFWEWKEAGKSKDRGCPKYQAMKSAKVDLRKAQRSIAARERQEAYEEIIQAKESDPQLFYKLVNNQRKSPYSGDSHITFPQAQIACCWWAASGRHRWPTGGSSSGPLAAHWRQGYNFTHRSNKNLSDKKKI